MKSWKFAQARHLDYELESAIHLARCNPDYQTKYPQEVKDNPEGKVLLKCHVEAKIRILAEQSKMLKRVDVPKVLRPKRLNRFG